MQMCWSNVQVIILLVSTDFPMQMQERLKYIKKREIYYLMFP